MKQDYLTKIEAASNLAEVEAIEQELFGRKEGVLTLAFQSLKNLDQEAKVQKAQELNATKTELTEAIEQKKLQLEQPSDAELQKEKLDVTLPQPKKEGGHLHLIPEFIRNLEELFGRMGFDVFQSDEVESEDFNFNFLNIPDDHPARDGQDTFWIKNADRMVLRTQTSPGQIHYMRSHEPPFRAIFPGKVYRKDSDATHSPMFHQIEGLMIGKDVTLGNLKATLETAMKELVSADATFRWRTGFFPFTEPSLEMDMMWRGKIGRAHV